MIDDGNDESDRCCQGMRRFVNVEKGCVDESDVPLLLRDGACDTGFTECNGYQPVSDSVSWCDETFGEDDVRYIACVENVFHECIMQHTINYGRTVFIIYLLHNCKFLIMHKTTFI